jgi:protocatechuate 3,4-dioxygenase beta subunit
MELVMRLLLGLLATALVATLVGLWLLSSGDPSHAAGPAAVGPGGGRASAAGGTLEHGSDQASPGTRTAAAPDPAKLEAAGQPAHGVEAEPSPRLVGRVVDGEGQPIPGAQVRAATGWDWMRPPLDMEDDGIGQGWVKRAEAMTDPEGRFALDEPLVPGELRLALRAEGFAARYEENLKLGDTRPQDLGDLVLMDGVTLAGRVVDRGGKGVAGVQLLQIIERGMGGHGITVPGRGVPLGATAADGSFRVSGLGPGPWGLILDSPEHQVREERGRTEEAGEQQGLLFMLEAGDEVTGLVVGLPAPRLAGARVDARVAEAERRREDVELHPRARRALIGSDGRFRIAGLIPGVAHNLTLWELEDDGRYQRALDVPGLEVWPGSRDVRLEVQPRASLTVKVVDATSGQPVEDFVFFAAVGANNRGRELALEGDDDSALRHHPGGRATFEDLRPPEAGGEAKVRIVAPGYADLERAGLPLRRGEDKDLGLLELTPGPVLVVTVTGAPDGAPVEGARVLVATEKGQRTLDWFRGSPEADPWSNVDVRAAVTGPDGRARVSLVPAERCVAIVQADGFLDAEPSPVPALAGGETSAEFALELGAHVMVEVVDGAGAPRAGAEIRYRPEGAGDSPQGNFGSFGSRGGGAGKTATTDQAGQVEVGPLKPGAWTFSLGGAEANSEANPAEPQVLELSEGGQYGVTLVTPPTGHLHGRVEQSRVALAGAELRLSPAPSAGGRGTVPGRNFRRGRGRLTALSRYDGGYSIEDVPCGEYRLQVTHADRYMPEFFELTITEGDNFFDVELPQAVLEGTVRYLDGRPVPGLTITVSAADGRGASWRTGAASLIEDDGGRLRPDWNSNRRRVKTNAEGAYRVAGVAAGVDLTLACQGQYAVPGRLEGIRLAPDEERRGVDLEVAVGGRLRVGLAPGVPGGAWLLSMRRQVDEGEQRSTQLWGHRTRLVDGLAVGTWMLELRPSGGAEGEPSMSREVEVLAEQTTEVRLELQ